jgi:hypothetical protein
MTLLFIKMAAFQADYLTILCYSELAMQKDFADSDLLAKAHKNM